MNYKYRIKSFIKFLIHAKPASGYGVHSPFAYKFLREVIRDAKKNHPELNPLIHLKNELMKDKREILFSDLGAKNFGKKTSQKISSIARTAITIPKYWNLIFSIARHFKPSGILELGTSLGFSAAAISLAAENIEIHTIEGIPEIANLAQITFNRLGLKNIVLHIGPFDELLPSVLSLVQTPFLVFIDGNHRYDSTVRYFDLISKKADNNSIVIIDDIHWSEEMERAWDEICCNNFTTIGIDLYRMGIIFFNKGLPQQKFCILY